MDSSCSLWHVDSGRLARGFKWLSLPEDSLQGSLTLERDLACITRLLRFPVCVILTGIQLLVRITIWLRIWMQAIGHCWFFLITCNVFCHITCSWVWLEIVQSLSHPNCFWFSVCPTRNPSWNQTCRVILIQLIKLVYSSPISDWISSMGPSHALIMIGPITKARLTWFWYAHSVVVPNPSMHVSS